MSKLIFKTVVGEQHPTTTYTKALDEMILFDEYHNRTEDLSFEGEAPS